MAKFRNLLVHRYTKIDAKKLHQIINENIDDIQEYTKQILAHI